MTEQERSDRLIELSMTLRVWPHDVRPENRTLGLIALCEEWVGRDWFVVEVGCFAGVSTEVFALFAKRVWAVDAWEPCEGATAMDREMLAWAERTFRRRRERYDNIYTLRRQSPEAASFLGNGIDIDMVYLDGDHAPAAIEADVRAWLPKVRPGGILAGHDAELAVPVLKGLGLAPERVYEDGSWVIQMSGARGAGAS